MESDQTSNQKELDLAELIQDTKEQSKEPFVGQSSLQTIDLPNEYLTADTLFQNQESIFDTIASRRVDPILEEPVVDNTRCYDLPTNIWLDNNLFHDLSPMDDVQLTLNKHYSPYDRPSRKLYKLEDVVGLPDTEAFYKLLASGQFRVAAQLCRSRLVSNQINPGQVDKICRLWFIRGYCLSKLKLFDYCQVEYERLGILLDKAIDPAISVPARKSKDDVRSWDYEHYSDLFPNRRGSLVSFELRNFHALFPSYKGDYEESLNRLYQLLYICKMNKKVTTNVEYADFWQSDDFYVWKLREIRLELQVSGILVELKDYDLAVQVLSSILQAVKKYASQPTSLTVQNTLQSLLMDIPSAIGRCYLQLGNVVMAENVFKALEESFTKFTAESHAQLAMNRGLLKFALGDFEGANKYFTHMLAASPSGVGANNIALTQLYSGDVNQAISFLEGICIEKPSDVGVCEPLLFNLTTMYDLVDSSQDRKKKILALVLSKWAGDSFNVDCLKLQ